MKRKGGAAPGETPGRSCDRVLVTGEHGIEAVPLRTIEGGFGFEFRAAPGLYQFSVIADARGFDWEELYLTLNVYGNAGQRTGPWDFNLLDSNKPLVPAFWVELNGRRTGLWYFQRVSVADLAARRFRGRMAFHVPGAGPVALRFIPYREMTISWTSARLEPDPEDRLEPPPFPVAGAARSCPAAEWAAPAYWRQMRRRLETTHAVYAPPLRRAFDWLAARDENRAPDDLAGQVPPDNRIQLLLADWRLNGSSAARDLALRSIDASLARLHWGNPRADGYGHDGDMGAARTMRSLAWARHAFAGELGAVRRARLLEKLALQGDRFFELALLNRDYWGGSLIQDHGWRSLFDFGTASLSLLGELPEARRWVSWIIPRLERGLDAMPRDGVIPPSSHYSLALYTDELTHYRDALLAAGGGDIFSRPHFRAIVDYLVTVAGRPAGLLATADGLRPFIGGNAFLNRMAGRYGDGRAARLALMLLAKKRGGFYHASQENAYFLGALWGFLSHDPAVRPAARLPVPRRLTFFEDSGLAHYRDARTGLTLSVQCGPWCGHNARRRAPGPCDRLGGAPGAGHFLVALGTRPLLVTPDGGYRLHSGLRSCLLIDGRGQHDDIGYPMSIPSKEYRGEDIRSVRWDEKTGRGLIVLDLAPAYPRELGVASYTREFILTPGRRLVCRDHVVLDGPRRLSWLFQGRREDRVRIEKGLRARFGSDPALDLEPAPGAVPLTAGVHETGVVWSYASASGFKPFDHVRYDTREKTAVACLDFVFNW